MKIKLKSHYISLFVSNYLAIENVVFDASDLSFPVNSTCWYNRVECCAYDSSTGTYIPTSAAPPGYICDTIVISSALSSTDTPSSSVMYDPSFTVTQPLGFINTRFLKDYNQAKYPRVALYNTQVINFYNYNPYSHHMSFIHVDLLSGHIKLDNVTVNNYFFPRGFISNYGNFYEDSAKERIYTCKDAGTHGENDTTACYSLEIANSSFSYYNKQLYSAISGIQLDKAKNGTYSWNSQTILQEGAVINLQSFDGTITITNSIFQ